jgi:Golgi phosphoprotein 3
MGEGLTRRRAGNAGSPTTGSSDQLPSSSNPSSSSAPRASNDRSGVVPSGSSVDGRGQKIAYDPRDFQDDAESNKMPRLTLMEEVLLLGLKDKAVRSIPSSFLHNAWSKEGS